MAAVESFAKVSSKGMKMEDLNKLSNIFASEFNNSVIHDRVLCFEVIKDEELETKVDYSEDNESESNGSEGILSLSKSSDICDNEMESGEKSETDGNVFK